MIFYECFIGILCPFSGKTEAYLEAIRKNIEWLKKHNKKGNKEGKDLVRLQTANFTHFQAFLLTEVSHNQTGVKRLQEEGMPVQE